MRRNSLLVAALVGVSAVGVALPTAVAEVRPGLVAAYGFDEASGATVLDASTSGASGTVSGAARVPGKAGGALRFDGADDRVDVPHKAALALTTGMTLEAWVRPTTVSDWRTVVMKTRSGGLSYGLYSSGTAPRPSSYLNTGGADVATDGPASLPLSAWSHVASTYDGTTSRLFVNGVQVAQRALSGALAASSGPLSIGGNAVWGEYFAGDLDEVRVYDRALAAAEIVSDMTTPVGDGQQPPPPPGAAQVGSWTGPVELGLVAVNMVQLHTGKILMWGGENDGGTTATVWDPATSARKAVPGPYNLFCSGHAQLADGRILVVGGHDNAGGILGSAQAAIFDPVTERWTSVPPMSQRRWYPSATTLPDGKIVVTSGAKASFDDIADVPEVYDPATNRWTRLEQAKLAFPYYPFSFVLPDGRLLIAGAGEHPAATRALDVATQQWTTLDGRLLDGGSAAMYRPGKVVKSGTAATTDVDDRPAAATTYVLDATQAPATWRQTAPMAFARAYHTLTPLPDGTVIATGGGSRTEGKRTADAVYEAEIWSPATETWRTMARMTVPRQYHGTALLMPDGRVVVAGSGDSYGGPDQTVAEFFSPPYLHQGARPSLSGAPATAGPGQVFSVTTSGAIASVALVRLGAVTHQFDEDARYVPLTFSQQGSTVSVTAPGPTSAPPGYYLLYAVDDKGVPSVGSTVRIGLAGADTQAPTPPDQVTATAGSGRVDLSWAAASDDVGVVRYAVHRSATAGFVPSATTKVADTTSRTWADTGLAAGTWYYRVTAQDAAGNTSIPSAQVSAVVLGDTTAPTVSVTSPAQGATVTGTLTLGATAQDDVGVAGVQFRVDGVPLGVEDTTAPYTASWGTGTATNGSHSVDAVARDAAGNRTTSAPVTVTVANTAPPPAPAGLVGAWSFDEGSGTVASDRSGRGNHGAVAGPSWTVSGRHGGALSFDGTDDRVDVPDSASLDLTTGMTVEAWVRPATGGGWRTVVMKERSTSGLAYAAYASDDQGRPAGVVRIGTRDRPVSAASALPLDTWSHLAVTYDGAALRTFVNGSQVGSAAMTGTLAVSGNPLRIGGNAVWSEWFRGSLDEVRVYNRALTAADIARDMAAPVG